MLRLCALALLMASAKGWLWKEDPWTALRVKWDLVPWSNGFMNPLKWKDSTNGVSLGKFCPGASNSQFEWVDADATFLAYEAVAKSASDYTIVLLYDASGQVAGMQNWLPAIVDGTAWTPGAGVGGQHYVQVWRKSDDAVFFVSTWYFEEPTQMCTTGRTNGKEFVGEGLWIQQGPDPANPHHLFRAPAKQKDIDAMDDFADTGKCFPTMGQHYWRNTRADTACEDMVPYCLLYNKGKLTAACFASNSPLDSTIMDSPKPTSSVLSKFMKTPPTCADGDDPKYSMFSTAHVYFDDSPRSSFC